MVVQVLRRLGGHGTGNVQAGAASRSRSLGWTESWGIRGATGNGVTGRPKGKKMAYAWAHPAPIPSTYVPRRSDDSRQDSAHDQQWRSARLSVHRPRPPVPLADTTRLGSATFPFLRLAPRSPLSPRLRILGPAVQGAAAKVEGGQVFIRQFKSASSLGPAGDSRALFLFLG